MVASPKIYETVYFSDEKTHKELRQSVYDLDSTISAILRLLLPSLLGVLKKMIVDRTPLRLFEIKVVATRRKDYGKTVKGQAEKK